MMKDFLMFLCFVFLLDAVFGDPRGGWHPVAVFGRIASRVEAFCRKRFGNGIASGCIGWLMMTVPAAVLAWGIVFLTEEAGGKIAGGIVSAGICYFTVALRSLTDHARRIGKALAEDDLPGARKKLSMIVSRDTESLGEHDIVRSGIESIGENLNDAVTSPYFWMAAGWLCGGFPGAACGGVFLRAVNTLDACWGYRTEKYLLFGRVAARADDVVHFLPARLTLLAVALAGGHPVRTLRTGIRHCHDHPSPNSCFGMAGFAGALGVRLGGPTVYGGVLESYPYWDGTASGGDAEKKLTGADLVRAEKLAWRAAAVFLGFLACGMMVFG